MSESQDEWLDDDAVYQNGADVYTRPESRGVLPTILTWLLATTALGWIAASAWYIDRVLGWQTVPELLPHEIGGLSRHAGAACCVVCSGSLDRA